MERATFNRWFRLERVGLSAGSLAAPLRLMHLSDLHVDRFGPRHSALLEVLRRERPDLILFTGDLVGRSPTAWEALGRLLESMEAPLGLFACRGNWEVSRGPGIARLRQWLAQRGARLLVNEWCEVESPGGRVRVCGVDDLAAGWPDLEAAVGAGRPQLGILLSHAPLAARLLPPEAPVHIVLSGHTHGGQIRVPLLWRLWLPPCHGGYLAGRYQVNGRMLYVSRGFDAAAPFNRRFRCPAEATLVEVRASGDAIRPPEDATPNATPN